MKWFTKLKNTGVKTFIIHARKAMLGKFTPKQNLNIPPLKYDVVYNLKKDFKDEEIATADQEDSDTSNS